MLFKWPSGSGGSPNPSVASRAIALAFASASVFVVGSCGVGDTTDSIDEIRVGTITIDSAPAALERGFHQTFTATVKDPKDKVITVPLVWRSSNERVATFEPDGRLLARDTGLTGITASALGVSSAPVGVRVKFDGAAKLAVFQWTPPDAATPGNAITDSVRVGVTNIRDALVPSAKVIFAVTAGGGSVSPTSAVTSSRGIAATQWTLGPAAGTNTISATVVNDDDKPNELASPNRVSFSVRSFLALQVVEGDAQQGLVLSKL